MDSVSIPFPRQAVVIIAGIGALLVLVRLLQGNEGSVQIGACINWYVDSGPGAKFRILNIYAYTIALVVPVYSLLAHFRKARQLFAIAILAAFLSINVLAPLANAYRKLLMPASSQTYSSESERSYDFYNQDNLFRPNIGAPSPSFTPSTSSAPIVDYNSHGPIPLRLAGLIIQMIGILLSLAPVWQKVIPQRAPIIVSVISAICWLVAGILYAIPENEHPKAPGFMYSCFLFCSWVIVSALKRSNSITVALVCAEVSFIDLFVDSVGLYGSDIRMIAGYVALGAIVIHLVWFLVDLLINVPTDDLKPKEQGLRISSPYF